MRHSAFFYALRPPATNACKHVHQGMVPHSASHCVGTELMTDCPQGNGWQGGQNTFFSSETIRSRVQEGGIYWQHELQSSARPLSAAYRWKQLEARWVATVTDQEGVDG